MEEVKSEGLKQNITISVSNTYKDCECCISTPLQFVAMQYGLDENELIVLKISN